MLIDCLWTYGTKQRTGELIVSGDGEVHFFFVAGRLAWGSSTLSKRAFSGYLIRHHICTQDQVRQALVEGRKAGTPFGQILLAKNQCSSTHLKDAAEFQIAAAMADAEHLLGEGAAQVFLDRGAHPWETQDCFPLAIFLEPPCLHEQLAEKFLQAASETTTLERVALIHSSSAAIIASHGLDGRHSAFECAEVMRAFRRLSAGEAGSLELMAQVGNTLRLFRSINETHFLVACASASESSLGLARLELCAIALAVAQLTSENTEATIERAVMNLVSPPQSRDSTIDAQSAEQTPLEALSDQLVSQQRKSHPQHLK
jgi:hypothetical protein